MFSLSWSRKQSTRLQPLKALHFLGSGVCILPQLPSSQDQRGNLPGLCVGVFKPGHILVFDQQALVGCLLVQKKQSERCWGSETPRGPSHSSEVGTARERGRANTHLAFALCQDLPQALPMLIPFLLSHPMRSVGITSIVWMRKLRYRGAKEQGVASGFKPRQSSSGSTLFSTELC